MGSATSAAASDNSDADSGVAIADSEGLSTGSPHNNLELNLTFNNSNAEIYSDQVIDVTANDGLIMDRVSGTLFNPNTSYKCSILHYGSLYPQ